MQSKKWNCSDNNLYLYVALMLNDLGILWYTIGYLQVCDLRWKLTTKWNCGNNNLYLYIILILNDLAMLWCTIGFIQVYGLY